MDEVPVPEPVTGRLFLCGKHAVGPDPEELLSRVGASTVVCLNEAFELEARYPNFVGWLRANSPARAFHHPIPDLHAPDVEELAELIEALHARLSAGEGLVVSCGAGIGRAGTVAVALLMRAGVPRVDAMVTVRQHRPMAGPESGAQTEVLAAFEERLHRAAGG